MKSLPALLLGLVAATAPLASAQTTTTTASVSPTFGAGTREFTLSAAGASDRRFSGSTGGASGSLGWFLNDSSEVVFRQSVNFSTGGNPIPTGPGTGTTGATTTVQPDRRQVSASTRFAFDQHFSTGGAFRPFLGVNLGGVYGRSVRDSWAAGLEGGGKFYVQPRTFIIAMIDYSWFFNRARNIDNRFRSGQFNWTAGVGFNF